MRMSFNSKLAEESLVIFRFENYCIYLLVFKFFAI